MTKINATNYPLLAHPHVQLHGSVDGAHEVDREVEQLMHEFAGNGMTL